MRAAGFARPNSGVEAKSQVIIHRSAGGAAPSKIQNDFGGQLEINREVGLHEFFRSATRAVAKDQIILLGTVIGRRKADVDVLVVGRVGGEEWFAGVAVDEISILILGQNKEINVRTIVIRRRANLLHERFVVAMQARDGDVGRNFEGKCCRRAERKSLMQNGLGGGRGRTGDAILSRNYHFFLGWRVLLLTRRHGKEKSADKKERQETNAQDLVHP